MNDELKEKFRQAVQENIDSKKIEQKNSRLPKSIFIIPGFVFILILSVTYLLKPYSYSETRRPYGKINSPDKGTKTGGIVNVSGETKNIGVGEYIWIAVDKPGIGLCWPKVCVKGNTKFSTTIFEEGPKGEFILSMYILNENFNQQWKNHEILGGLHMPPDSKRIESVKLLLK